MKTRPVTQFRKGMLIFHPNGLMANVEKVHKDGTIAFAVYNGAWSGTYDPSEGTISVAGDPPIPCAPFVEVLEYTPEERDIWYLKYRRGGLLNDEPEYDEDMVPF